MAIDAARAWGPDAVRPPERRFPTGEASRNTYAALDLGTNNCRLLVARPTFGERHTGEAGARDSFVVVDAFSRIVRLGEGLSSSGRLSDAAMDRAVAALGVCADKLRRRNVCLSRAVATEACRQATNGRDFVSRVLHETGIALDVIPPSEEARLAVLGCHTLLEPGEGPALVFDIGGGSTELVLVANDSGGEGGCPRIVGWVSAPWGVVSLTESERGEKDTEAQRLDAYARMKARVAEAFAGFAAKLPHAPGGPRLLGTSGTVTTLASVHLGLASYDRRAVDGLIMPSDAMRDISGMLSAMSLAERAELPCIGHERADLVVAGCAILEAILDIWPTARLGIADRGIREGILRGLMARDGYSV